MDFDKFDFLPEWDDEMFNGFEDDEGEEWKTGHKLEAAKSMYNQWREVYALVMVFAANLADEGDAESHAGFVKGLIYENALIVAPKIMGAASTDLYVLKMENAAIIRTNCRQMMEQVGVAVLMDWADEGHQKVIAEAVDKFRELFKQWVAGFERDEYEDEWGLFI